MRPKSFTLTAPQVHRCAAVVLQDHLKLGDHGPKCRASLLFTLLLYAAARITSLSDACKTLATPPPTRPHAWPSSPPCPILPNCSAGSTPPWPTTCPGPCAAARSHMAADLVLIPYHGQPQHDPDEIYRSEAKSGTSHFHAYATLYVVRNGYRFTVALTPVSRGEPLEAVLKRLLHQAAQVGIRCRLLLLDRGFYSVGVIRYLQAAHHPFLMPVICRGRRLDDPRGPSGTNVFLTWQSSGFGTYTLHDAQKRPARVAICVKCRYYRGQWRRHGKQHLIYAFWGLQPPSFDWVRETYRQRFGIETTYRQLHQARIRTSTRDPALRLLYVGIALILRNVWVWLHQMVLARPRRGGREIRLDLLRFRRMLLWLTHVVEGTLGVRDSVTVELQL